MHSLYEILETNSIENNNLITKKVELLYDMNGEKYCIQYTENTKKIICVSGSCDLKLEKDGLVETITLNHPSVTIKIDKNVSIEISNYTEQTKIAVEHIELKREVSCD